jgi:sarcosine oxidase subunit gamma
LGLPVSIGGATLCEVVLGPVTSIAPFRGRESAVADALGLLLPAPGRMQQAGEMRLHWVGPGRVLLVGREAPSGLYDVASVVEQGDGIAAARLDGWAARDVLARLVPLDLGDVAFPDGATARTMLNHMTITLTRVGPLAYEVMTMRSMALTLVNELTEAMRHVEARSLAKRSV